MRSSELRRHRAERPKIETARPGAAALLQARGTPRRTPRALDAAILVPAHGLAARAGVPALPAPPKRRTLPAL